MCMYICTLYLKDTASCVSARTVHGCTVAFGSGWEGGTCWGVQRFLLKWLRYRPEHDVKLLIKRWELCVVVQWSCSEWMERALELAVQRLREAAETAKIELASKVQADIKVPFITPFQTGPKLF